MWPPAAATPTVPLGVLVVCLWLRVGTRAATATASTASSASLVAASSTAAARGWVSLLAGLTWSLLAGLALVFNPGVLVTAASAVSTKPAPVVAVLPGVVGLVLGLLAAQLSCFVRRLCWGGGVAVDGGGDFRFADEVGFGVNLHGFVKLYRLA